MKRLSIEQLLGIDKFAVDGDEAHIVLDEAVCSRCSSKPCTFACPAGLYTLKVREIVFDYAGCLECGTCRVVCPKASVAMKWKYPRGGFGINFRYG